MRVEGSVIFGSDRGGVGMTMQLTLLSFIPAKCWMAPDIPTAI